MSENGGYDRILFDAYYKSQDPRDLTKIEAVLKKIADYEKEVDK